MKLFDLTGRVAVVTGGNGGLGLAIARGLAEAGATIVIAARDRAKSESAIEAVRAQGAACSFVETHVDDEASCARLPEAVTAEYGRLDILVNNAGMNIRKRPEDYSLAEWNAVLGVNLTGAFLCSQAAHPALKASGGGKIINIGSLFSTFGGAMAAPYAASKGGIVQLTKSLATAWARDNIQVNAILPGWHHTDLTERARRDLANLDDAVKARTPAGRWGEPEDIVGAAIFMAAPASNFVTGASIAVDGGYSAQG